MTDGSLADPPHAVRITSDGLRAQVLIDGNDLSQSLSAYTLEHRSNQPPLLMMYALPSVDGAVFDGYAQVAVATEPTPTAATAIVTFLASIDPARLQQAALNRVDLDGTPTELTTALLRQLTEWAHEGESP